MNNWELQKMVEEKDNEMMNEIFDTENVNYFDNSDYNYWKYLLENQESDESDEKMIPIIIDNLRYKYMNLWADLETKMHDGIELTDREKQNIISYYVYFSKFSNEERTNWISSSDWKDRFYNR